MGKGFPWLFPFSPDYVVLLGTVHAHASFPSFSHYLYICGGNSCDDSFIAPSAIQAEEGEISLF